MFMFAFWPTESFLFRRFNNIRLFKVSKQLQWDSSPKVQKKSKEKLNNNKQYLPSQRNKWGTFYLLIGDFFAT